MFDFLKNKSKYENTYTRAVGFYFIWDYDNTLFQIQFDKYCSLKEKIIVIEAINNYMKKNNLNMAGWYQGETINIYKKQDKQPLYSRIIIQNFKLFRTAPNDFTLDTSNFHEEEYQEIEES